MISYIKNAIFGFNFKGKVEKPPVQRETGLSKGVNLEEAIPDLSTCYTGTPYSNSCHRCANIFECPMEKWLQRKEGYPCEDFETSFNLEQL
ncbi:MAG: hypothetical protein ACRC0F_03190 [Cetobacterium sp.]